MIASTVVGVAFFVFALYVLLNPQVVTWDFLEDTFGMWDYIVAAIFLFGIGSGAFKNAERERQKKDAMDVAEHLAEKMKGDK